MAGQGVACLGLSELSRVSDLGFRGCSNSQELTSLAASSKTCPSGSAVSFLNATSESTDPRQLRSVLNIGKTNDNTNHNNNHNTNNNHFNNNNTNSNRNVITI